MTEDAAVRLGRLIRGRRKTLKLTQSDVQAAGGPSTATLRLIEGGRHTDFRPSTSQPLEAALQWQAGSIAAVLDGGEPTPIPHVAATFSSSGGMTATAKATGTGVVAEDPKDQQELEKAVALSFLADEVDAASSLSSPEPDADPDDIADYISDVEQLVNAADELTDSVHKSVLEAFGGDVAKLRQMKREVRRVNMAKSARQSNILALARDLTPTDDEEAPTQSVAARIAPPGYTPGQSEQGDAGGEEKQDMPREPSDSDGGES